MPKVKIVNIGTSTILVGGDSIDDTVIQPGEEDNIDVGNGAPITITESVETEAAECQTEGTNETAAAPEAAATEAS